MGVVIKDEKVTNNVQFQWVHFTDEFLLWIIMYITAIYAA